LQKDKLGRYYFESHLKSILPLVNIEHFEWTQGLWKQEKVKPFLYYYSVNKLGNKKELSLRFNWRTGKVVDLDKQKPWDVKLPGNVQSKLSYQLAMRQDLINGKKKLNYLVADDGELEQYNFKILGEEVLDTALGRLKTIKIVKVTGSPHRRLTLWAAKDLNYLLVKITEFKDGKEKASALITSVNWG